MNVAVMTTGPGVIRPIATASRNCPSVSQWWSWTTPWRRNGTMARPLPKMNAPALKKNQPNASSVPPPAPNRRPLPATGPRPSTAGTAGGRGRRSQRGGASRTIMSRPAAMNSTAISAPVTAVTTPSTALMVHSRQSRRLVIRASLYAATAMIAITAGGVPADKAWGTGRPPEGGEAGAAGRAGGEGGGGDTAGAARGTGGGGGGEAH